MTEFVETCRGLVRPADCNEYGVLGTPALTARLGDAIASALARLGHGPRALARLGQVVRIHGETIERKAVLRPGELFHVETRVQVQQTGTMAMAHRLINSATGALAATATTELEGPSEAMTDRGEPTTTGKPGLVTFRGRVAAAECDQMRHMNVQYYLDKGFQGLAQLAGAAGLVGRSGAGSASRLHAIHDRVLFEGEVHAGDVLIMRTGVRAVIGDHIHLASILEAVETGHVAARFETIAGLWDPRTGEPLPLPGNARQALDRLTGATEKDFPPPRPIEGPRLAPHIPDNAFRACQRAVNTWEADADGIATPGFQISCVSDGAMHLFAHLGADHGWRSANDIGSAALDYDIHYLRPLPIGAPIALNSHFLELRNRPFRFGHHLVASDTGQVATTIEVTAVLFDLTARKAIATPDMFRERALALMAVTPEDTP